MKLKKKKIIFLHAKFKLLNQCVVLCERFFIIRNVAGKVWETILSNASVKKGWSKFFSNEKLKINLFRCYFFSFQIKKTNCFYFEILIKLIFFGDVSESFLFKLHLKKKKRTNYNDGNFKNRVRDVFVQFD